MSQIDLSSGVVDFKAMAGDDIAFTITLPFNSTGGTHELLISESRPGSTVLTLTSGSGLSISNGTSSVVSVAIPASFTAGYGSGKTLVYDYKLTLGDLKRTRLSGSLELVKAIT